MNLTEFKNLVKQLDEGWNSLMFVQKHADYSRNGDKLHNFKRAAVRRSTIPEDALMGMAEKHFVSIEDMVDDLVLGIEHPLEKWDEKLCDAVNYYKLLRALLEERYADVEPE